MIAPETPSRTESSYAKMDTDWLAALCLELDGRTIPQRGVQALGVVELNIAAHGASYCAFGGEIPPVVHVRFHRLVPRFHVRVVGHAMRAVDGLHQSRAG